MIGQSTYDDPDMDMNGLTISAWIADLGIWPLVVVLVPNLMFRRYGQGASKKRMSSLMQAIAVFLITTAAAFIVERGLSDKYLLGAVAVVAVLLYIFRSRVFPYRLTCAECDARLEFKTIYFMDDNLCTTCHSRKVAAEEAAREAAEATAASPGASEASAEETETKAEIDNAASEDDSN